MGMYDDVTCEHALPGEPKPKDNDMWFEYEAKFADGRLIEIQPKSIYRNDAGGSPDVFYPPPDQAHGA